METKILYLKFKCELVKMPCDGRVHFRFQRGTGVADCVIVGFADYYKMGKIMFSGLRI